MNVSRLRSTPAALGMVFIIAAALTSLAVLSITGPRADAQSDPPGAAHGPHGNRGLPRQRDPELEQP